MGRHVARMGKGEGTEQLGRPRHRWEDNTEVDLKYVGWGEAWIRLIGLGQVAGFCRCGNEPPRCISCREFVF